MFPKLVLMALETWERRLGWVFPMVRGEAEVSISVHGLNFPPVPKGAHSSYQFDQMWD